jgi:hypothetical protein
MMGVDCTQCHKSIERVVSSIQRTARFGLFLFRFGRKLQEKKLNKEENHFQLK